MNRLWIHVYVTKSCWVSGKRTRTVCVRVVTVDTCTCMSWTCIPCPLCTRMYVSIIRLLVYLPLQCCVCCPQLNSYVVSTPSEGLLPISLLVQKSIQIHTETLSCILILYT